MQMKEFANYYFLKVILVGQLIEIEKGNIKISLKKLLLQRFNYE
ncbi:hypothetical protein EV10_1102 [Prochlorococcus marinus str. SS51]|nr:hypothetical protein EV10_1102 [Prochlorococcus marinus str. SS51]